MNDAIVDIIHRMDMPSVHKAKAVLSFNAATLLYKEQVSLYSGLAPFAMAWIVQKLPWEAESLREEGMPGWWAAYENNVSVNGDKAPWVAGPDGVGVRQPCPLEDTDEARSYCYWAPGHHPRSKWARWVWLGIRNRASQLCYDNAAVACDDIELWGDPTVSTDREGTVVYRMGEYYQVLHYQKWGRFVIRRNLGWKISNHIKHNEPAALVYIPWSLKGWTGA
jgi:hypothetical protein